MEQGSAEDEGWRVKKSGESFWASVLITAAFDEQGEHRGFVKITRDLTERRKSQQLVQASERKDTFLATLAHELRNPLAPMAPGVEMILKAPHEKGRVVQIASMMRRQVGQMSRLIEDLVDLSRITSGKITLRRERASLTDVLECGLEAARPLIESKSHRLNLRLPPNLVEIDVDHHRLAQAVTNLLVNSAKYTPANGPLELHASVTRGRRLELVVRDNGNGIPGARLESIFKLFDQGGAGSPEGLGIGLTLVRTIVEMHGGAVVAKSGGEGLESQFTICLPVVLGSSVSQPVDQPGAIDRPKCRVLIADDSKSNADTLALFFESEGLEAVVAYDGKQAVELAGQTKPDIVCLDIGMPVLNGFQAARDIRKILPLSFVVAITGWGAEEDRKNTRDAGFDLHLVKPVRIEELSAAIREKFPKCYD